MSSASTRRMKGYQSTYSLNKGEPKDIIERCKSIIEKLKGKLDAEKKKLNQARMLYAKEVQSKTELSELLAQCAEEVKTEIINQKNTEFNPSSKAFNNAIDKKKAQSDKVEFNREQREKIVEMLLSQERVLALLYDKTFPAQENEQKAENALTN